jgi:hypothetical protein
VFPDLTSFTSVVFDNSPAAPLALDELPTREEEPAPFADAAAGDQENASTLVAEPPHLKENDAAFSFDGASAESATARAASQESAPVAVEESGNTDAPPTETPEWEDAWFAEETTPSETNADAEESASDDTEKDAAATASTSSDGFDWKLD